MSTDNLLHARNTTPESPSTTRPDSPAQLSPRAIRSMELESEVAEHAAQADNEDATSEHHSTSRASTSETRKYDMEPFSTFEPKVLQLCKDLFPTRDPHSFQLERIKGGSFNRIVGLTIQPVFPKKFTAPWFRHYLSSLCSTPVRKPAKNYIFRIPREDERKGSEMDYDVAVLKFAGENLKFPVPRVVRVDTGNENALGQQFQVQERLQGQNLAFVQENLTTEQLKCLTRQMVNIHRELQSITSARPGVVNPSTHSQSPPQLQLDKFNAFNPITGGSRGIPSVPQTTLEFLLDQCTRWQEYEVSKSAEGFSMLVWHQFKKIATHLHTRGFIPDEDKFHLSHLDLLGRNILVEMPDDNTVGIKGVLDWDADYVCFCPKFIAYRAPFWLWAVDDDHEEDETYANIAGEGPEKSEAKKMFEELAGEEWLRYAYAPEYIIARRMFKHLMVGFHTNWDYEDAETIVEEWKKLHPEDDVRTVWEEEDDEEANKDSDSSSSSSSSSSDSDSENEDDDEADKDE